MNLGMIIKLIGMVSMFKDVTNEVQKAGMEKRPWPLQRSVWGAILVALAGIGSTFLGVTIDPAILSQIADAIPQILTIGTGLWGSVLTVYGLFRKVKPVAKPAESDKTTLGTGA